MKRQINIWVSLNCRTNQQEKRYLNQMALLKSISQFAKEKQNKK